MQAEVAEGQRAVQAEVAQGQAAQAEAVLGQAQVQSLTSQLQAAEAALQQLQQQLSAEQVSQCIPASDPFQCTVFSKRLELLPGCLKAARVSCVFIPAVGAALVALFVLHWLQYSSCCHALACADDVRIASTALCVCVYRVPVHKHTENRIR